MADIETRITSFWCTEAADKTGRVTWQTTFAGAGRPSTFGGGLGLWLLRLRDTGEFVGDCGLTPQQVDGSTEIEVGYHVRTAFQGRGLATEAASACRDFARDVLKAERLIAIIDPHNRPSQRVAEKLGLVVERTSDNHGRWSSPQRIYAMPLEEILPPER